MNLEKYRWIHTTKIYINFHEFDRSKLEPNITQITLPVQRNKHNEWWELSSKLKNKRHDHERNSTNDETDRTRWRQKNTVELGYIGKIFPSTYYKTIEVLSYISDKFRIRFDIRVLLYHRKITTRINVSRIGINDSQKYGRSEDESEENTSINHQITIRNAVGASTQWTSNIRHTENFCLAHPSLIMKNFAFFTTSIWNNVRLSLISEIYFTPFQAF